MSTRMLDCLLTVPAYPKIFKMKIVSLVDDMLSLFVLLSLKRQHPMPEAHRVIAIITRRHSAVLTTNNMTCENMSMSHLSSRELF
jgi:hypothetical protein